MKSNHDGGAGPADGDTKTGLLKVACEAAGGLPALAARLGISEAMLHKCMSGGFEMPDSLFLRAVDVLLEERERRYDWAAAPKPVPDGRADA